MPRRTTSTLGGPTVAATVFALVGAIVSILFVDAANAASVLERPGADWMPFLGEIKIHRNQRVRPVTSGSTAQPEVDLEVVATEWFESLGSGARRLWQGIALGIVLADQTATAGALVGYKRFANAVTPPPLQHAAWPLEYTDLAIRRARDLMPAFRA
eukprot:gene14499-8502_t